MPEIRQSIASKEWVIIATERARRPYDFIEEGREITEQRAAWQADCPFCPGNEEFDLEQMRVPDRGPWEVRAVRNKYPALDSGGEREHHFAGLHRWLSGVGHHEIIVEARQHNTSLALMEPEAVGRVLTGFQMRGITFAEDPRVEHVIYFENHGPRAGTSIEHPHAQMLGLPLVPFEVRVRSDEARRYFDDTGTCVYCDICQSESVEGTRVITANDHFVAFVPYAAFSPFHTWIMPRQHRSSFLVAGQGEIAALGEILHDVLRRLYLGLRDPDYNFIIRSAPVRRPGYDFLHWYLSIIPRVSESAGFEMGSGMFINTALPEESATFLREIDVDGLLPPSPDLSPRLGEVHE